MVKRHKPKPSGVDCPISRIHLFQRLSPLLRLAHDYRNAQPLRLVPRRICDHALLYFKYGIGTFKVADRTHPIAPHALFFVRPGIEHSFEAEDHPLNRMLNLHFDLVEHPDRHGLPIRGPAIPLPPAAERFPDAPRRKHGLPVYLGTIQRPLAYEALFFRVHAAFHSHSPARDLQTKAALLDLLAWLIDSASPVGEPLVEPMDRALAFMREHLAEPVSVQSIADAVHMSRAGFVRHFKARYHAPPMAILRRMRLEHARAILSETNLPVKQIAQDAGFISLHHFTRAFRQFSGQPPATFRHGSRPAQA